MSCRLWREHDFQRLGCSRKRVFSVFFVTDVCLDFGRILASFLLPFGEHFGSPSRARGVLEGLCWSQALPRWPERSPGGFLEAPKWLQEATKGAKNAPKKPQIAPKVVPKAQN